MLKRWPGKKITFLILLTYSKGFVFVLFLFCAPITHHDQNQKSSSWLRIYAFELQSTAAVSTKQILTALSLDRKLQEPILKTVCERLSLTQVMASSSSSSWESLVQIMSEDDRAGKLFIAQVAT